MGLNDPNTKQLPATPIRSMSLTPSTIWRVASLHITGLKFKERVTKLLSEADNDNRTCYGKRRQQVSGLPHPTSGLDLL